MAKYQVVVEHTQRKTYIVEAETDNEAENEAYQSAYWGDDEPVEVEEDDPNPISIVRLED
jgi:hypothetical protein